MFNSLIGGRWKNLQIAGFVLAVCLCFAAGALIGYLLKSFIPWPFPKFAWFEALNNGFDPSWDQYDCDIRVGCNTAPLTRREVTNIEQERQRDGMGRNIYTNPNQESFCWNEWRPGVDRPMIASLEVDKIIRSDEINEGMTGRDKMNFVMQQFGNDGTIIPPSSNPLYNPAPPTLM